MTNITTLRQIDSSGKAPVLPTAEREMIRRVLTAGWDDPTLGIVEVVGDAGIGKTMAAREWVGERPRARLLITLTKATGTMRSGMGLFVDALGAVSQATAYRIAPTILRRIDEWRGIDGRAVMVVFDEFQFASDDLVEELRHVHDETGIGLAFLGNPQLRNRFRFGKGGDHIASRLGPRLDLTGLLPESVALVARHHKVAGAREVRRLEELARLGGNLRSVDKIVREARRLCGDARMPLTLDYIEQAARMLGVVR